MAAPMPTILAPDPPDGEVETAIEATDVPYDAIGDGNTLSPRSAAFPRSVHPSGADSLAPPALFSPSTTSTHSASSSPAIGSDNENSGSESANGGPFNFQTQTYTVGSPPKGKSVRRRYSALPPSILTLHRRARTTLSDAGAVTSTLGQAYRIRLYFLLLLGHRYRCLRPFPSQLYASSASR